MKTRKYTWGNRAWEFYNPKVNRKRQIGLIGFLGLCGIADIALPMTFGQVINLPYQAVKKLNPFFVYK